MSSIFKIPVKSSIAIGDLHLTKHNNSCWVFCRANAISSVGGSDGIFVAESEGVPQFHWIEYPSNHRQLLGEFERAGSSWRLQAEFFTGQQVSKIDLIYQSVHWSQSLNLPKLNMDRWSLVVSNSNLSGGSWNDGPCFIADRGRLIALLPAGSNGWINLSADHLDQAYPGALSEVDLGDLDSGLWFWNSLRKLISIYFAAQPFDDVVILRFQRFGVKEAICLAAMRSNFPNKTLAVELADENAISALEKRLIENLGGILLGTLQRHHPQMLKRAQVPLIQPILMNLNDQVAERIALHLNKDRDIFPRNIFSKERTSPDIL
jgi:hypothetical protein